MLKERSGLCKELGKNAAAHESPAVPSIHGRGLSMTLFFSPLATPNLQHHQEGAVLVIQM
jgi:hypothetical protein